MNASEDEKIRAMMDQSTKGFDQSKYVCLWHRLGEVENVYVL